MRDFEIYYNEISSKFGFVDYIVGIDEHGSASFPRSPRAQPADFFFLLSAVVVKPPRGLIDVVVEINDFKRKWFNSADVILHGSEMTSRKGIYRRLKEEEYKKRFFDDLYGRLERLSTKIIVVPIDKKYIYSAYSSPIHPYHAAVQMVGERIVGYLPDPKGKVLMWFEFRGEKEDDRLKEAIRNLSKYGYADERLPKYLPQQLKSIQWIYWGSNKSENIALLQLADIVAHFYGRYVRKIYIEKEGIDHIQKKAPEVAWCGELMKRMELQGKFIEARSFLV